MNREYYETDPRHIETKHEHPPKHIKGINCDVRSCVYHDGDSYCTAGRIAIGPSYAKACSETVCATFKQRTL